MTRQQEVVRRGIHQIPDLGRLEERLRDDPDGFITESLPSPHPRKPGAGRLVTETSRVRRTGGFEAMSPHDGDEEGVEAREPEVVVPTTLAGAAASAVAKVRADGAAAALTPMEQAGFEAIILLVGRPAILVEGGKFRSPPEEWAHLERDRASIERVLESVGRIEVTGHPGGLDWVGTGALVGDGVLMTNRHVAKEFCTAVGSGQWRFESSINAAVDFCEELGAVAPREFALEEVIGVHDRFDMALFYVSPLSRHGAPPDPLPVSASPPVSTRGREVYVVGYPASDSRRNDPVEMRRIFASIFDVKRLQPGTMTRFYEGDSLFEHDCSTLGGNSGSPVLDLETHGVVGLHFRGRYMESNTAVALWQLADDPLLQRAGVHFV